jgi:hypothetical protein
MTTRRRTTMTTMRTLQSNTWRATLGALAAVAHLPMAAAAQIVEVPLEVRGGRMVVTAHRADGTELHFLVTTGSSVTVLSESGASKIGNAEVQLGGIPVVMQGRQNVPDAALTVDGMVMDGIVSNNTLNRFDVLFDAPRGRLLIQPASGQPAGWPGVALSEPVRLRVYHGVVLGVDVEIDGKPYPGMLDLGAPTLLANAAVLEETGITDGAADLMLGGRVFGDVAIQESDHPVIESFSPNGDGFVVVGTPPALGCALAVSWVHRELRTCVP